uniref:TFIIS N-terminal domain-containing protein n=1 Tax=Leersia perrieri TaxID=77586 RepID=A0A0D9WTK7_9ORYZ
MAGELGGLRRWKRFLPAFSTIDAAIESENPGNSRAKHRDARLEIIEKLIDAADDAAVAEKLCAVLDDVMVQSLQTLEMVATLASTDLAKDVGGLRNHESGRVRCLAAGVVCRWMASVKDELAEVSAAMEKLTRLLGPDDGTDHRAKIILEQRNRSSCGTSDSMAKRNSRLSVLRRS